MADDQGWGDTSYNGHAVLRTPNLDAMAVAGLRLDRFYAAAPVCSPTRGSCLTGRHPSRYGIPGANRGHLPLDEPNLAAILKGRGYRTGHFGKWHLGTLTRDVLDSNRGGREQHTEHYAPPWQRSFDVCFSTEAKVPTFDPMRVPGTDEPYGTYYWNQEGARVTADLEGDDSRIVMDRVVPFVREAVAAKTPFLAVVWFHSPHKPVVAGADHRDLYPEVADEETREYYACLSAIDEQVGRLRAELARLGVTQNTVLWYTSDNGPEGNERAPGSTGGLRGRKRSLLEGGVRVPGILEWPGRIEGGRVSRAPAWTCDILPTLLEALQIADEKMLPLDGQSLLPLIDEREFERSLPLGFLHGDAAAWHEGRWKIHRGSAEEPFALYDLEDDPAEANDLALEQAKRVEAMAARLQAWIADCEDG